MKKTLLLTTALLTTALVSRAQVFPNAGLETWHNYTSGSLTLEAPDSWYGTDSLIAAMAPLAAGFGITIDPAKQLFQSTTIKHNGNAAAEVRSVNIGNDGGNVPGVLTNAKIGVDLLGLITSGALNDPSQIINYLSYSGGTAVTTKVDKVKAWVLLDSTNLDSAGVTALAVKTVAGSSGDSTVVLGQGAFIIPPGTNAFTEITIPLIYTSSETPEKLIVAFSSSATSSDTIHEGNKLYVDDASFSYDQTSIQQPLLAETQLLVYPVPATAVLYFNLNASLKAEDFRLTITDISGRIISDEQLKSQINAKEVKQWVKGMYTYTLVNIKNGKKEQGKFTVE